MITKLQGLLVWQAKHGPATPEPLTQPTIQLI